MGSFAERLPGVSERVERHSLPPDEPHLSPQEAALLCDVSVDTIRRRLHAGKLPRARRLSDDQWAPWSIPVGDLAAAGLCPASAIDDIDYRLNPDVKALREQVAELMAELKDAQMRCRSLEERLAQSAGEIEHHRRVIEALTSRPTLITEHQRSAS